MNSIVLAGKVADINLDNNTFKLCVERNYRNDKGEYESDTFICKPWKGMNNYLSSYLNNDDVLIIKGQLISEDNICTILIDQFSLMYRPKKKITT